MLAHPLFITPLFAIIFTLFYILLAYRVIKLRWKHKVSLLDGGVSPLTYAMRAHGNFSEYVPLSLVLFTLNELNGAPQTLLYAMGAILLLGRILHAYALTSKVFKPRVWGMSLSFLSLFLASASLIYTLFATKM